MAINKKTLAQVKRQVYKARVEEVRSAQKSGDPDALEQVYNGPTKREQMNQARLAARQVRGSIHQQVQQVSHYVALSQKKKEFHLKEGDLFRTVRSTCAVYPDGHISRGMWTTIDKGASGIILGPVRDTTDGVDSLQALVNGRGVFNFRQDYVGALRSITEADEDE